MNLKGKKIGKSLLFVMLVASIICCTGCEKTINNSIQNKYQMVASIVQEPYTKKDVKNNEEVEPTNEVESLFIENQTKGRTVSASEMIQIMKDQEKYRFKETKESIYAIKETYLKDKPFDDADDIIKIAKYDEIQLLGLNDYKYWKVEYKDKVYYIDSDSITREYGKIEEMKEEERREELKENFTKADLIIVGDSRMVGLESAVSTDAKVIAKVSAGLNWLKNTAIYEIRNYVNENSVIVLNFGVNDLYNSGNYVSYYNAIKEEFPNNQICFMSVNPVDEVKEAQHGYSVTNENIRNFNQKMKDNLVGIKYIDTYTYLMENGFSTGDGVHYKGDTYRDIYNYMLEHLF